jgi:light-regulated signal transduction histidine kinase (bacteriophytochrome)
LRRWPHFSRETDLTPIHAPGAIQPHGALLATLTDGLLVTHASANLLEILGRPAEAVLGRPLHQAIGEAASCVLRRAEAGDGTTIRQMHTMSGSNLETLHLRAYQSGRNICIDIVPIHPEPTRTSPVTALESVLETFKQATTRQELCDLAVLGLHAISGFDRVMAYRFAADEHGEVIAEVRAAQLESHLGLHFPAADLPPPGEGSCCATPSARSPIAVTSRWPCWLIQDTTTVRPVTSPIAACAASRPSTETCHAARPGSH